MHKIEITEYGVKLTFANVVNSEEIQKWHDELLKIGVDLPDEIGVLVDMTKIEPLSTQTQKAIFQLQKSFVSEKRVRSVVATNSPVVMRQLKDIASKTGVLPSERYINSQDTPNWEEIGLDYIINNIEPEDNPKMKKQKIKTTS